MKRTSIRPYEEITILSLANIAATTKFQFFCKVKEKVDAYVILSDDNSEYKFTFSEDTFVDIKTGDIALAFGQKDELDLKLEKLIKLNLDWSLLIEARTVEQM